MADPTKGIVKLIDISAYSHTQAQTAIGDLCITMEVAGFVLTDCQTETVQLNEANNSSTIAVLTFQKESILVPGNGSIKVIKQEIGHADLTDADTSQSVDFDEVVPAGALVVARAVKLTTAFSGGTVSACTIDFGDGVDADGYFDGEDVFTGATIGMHAKPSVLGALVASATADVAIAERTPAVKFDSTDGNVVAFTAGALTAYVWYVEQALGAAVP